MNTNDVYMTISHYHNNPSIIIVKRMILIEDIRCVVYTLGDDIEHILLQDDIDNHLEQLRVLKRL